MVKNLLEANTKTIFDGWEGQSANSLIDVLLKQKFEIINLIADLERAIITIEKVTEEVVSEQIISN